MAEVLSFSYDAVGDILYVQDRPPYAAQHSVMEGGTVIRRHPETGEVERIELMSFSLRSADDLRRMSIPESYRNVILSLKTVAQAA